MFQECIIAKGYFYASPLKHNVFFPKDYPSQTSESYSRCSSTVVYQVATIGNNEGFCTVFSIRIRKLMDVSMSRMNFFARSDRFPRSDSPVSHTFIISEFENRRQNRNNLTTPTNQKQTRRARKIHPQPLHHETSSDNRILRALRSHKRKSSRRLPSFNGGA
jgi:hypothetical protein